MAYGRLLSLPFAWDKLDCRTGFPQLVPLLAGRLLRFARNDNVSEEIAFLTLCSGHALRSPCRNRCPCEERSDEAIPLSAGRLLRFARNDNVSEEIAFPTLRSGQALCSWQAWQVGQA